MTTPTPPDPEGPKTGHWLNLCQRMRIRLARESRERDAEDDPRDEALAA